MTSDESVDEMLTENREAGGIWWLVSTHDHAEPDSLFRDHPASGIASSREPSTEREYNTELHGKLRCDDEMRAAVQNSIKDEATRQALVNKAAYTVVVRGHSERRLTTLDPLNVL